MATKNNYVCRFCGKEFENFVECVRHEKEKIRVLKEQLKDADTLVHEKYNDYVSALNEHAKIKKEINKIDFGEKDLIQYHTL